MPTVARVIGDRLRAAGIRYVLGHPGGEVIDLLEGFRQAGLEFVLARHETSAAFMADAMATVSGVPGVCVTTLGPGATNVVTGVAHAYLDRAPVLVFTGQLPLERYARVTHQRVDLQALFAPITKWRARVDPANAAAVVDRAVRVALEPRRGPVHLEVPSDVPAREGVPEAPERPTAAAPRAADAAAVSRAAALLRSARAPLLLVGPEAFDAAGAVRRLVDAWRIPVLASPKGKGIVREDSALFVGTIEGLGTARLFDFIDTRDLVLMVGFDPVEFDRDWAAPARVIHVGPLPNEDRYYPSEVELVGAIDATLGALLDAAGSEPRRAGDDVEAFRASFAAHVRPPRPGLTPQDVLAALRAALPEDALVTCDVGYNKAVATQCWPAYAPRTFFVSNGLSSMGYGLPAALGLKLARPDRAVACVVGDGGFAMTGAELETASRLGLALTVVVLADDALSQIKAGQERKGYPATGTEFRPLDYVALAKAYGAAGCEVETLADCRDALRDAATARQTRLIAAHIDPGAYQLDVPR